MFTEAQNDTFHEAWEFISNLDTPQAIALSLNSLGVKGIRGECSTCPLAVYFHNVMLLPVGKSLYVQVTIDTITVEYLRYTDGSDRLMRELTVPMRAFIKDFDNGKYRFLEEK